jgi:hypothetical protein
MKTYWDSSALIEALHDPKLRSRIRRRENETRPHSLAEVFSTLTKGVNFRYPPADAANMAAGPSSIERWVCRWKDLIATRRQTPNEMGGCFFSCDWAKL